MAEYVGNTVGTSKIRGILSYKTDLRSLQYGKQEEPYVYKDLPEDFKDSENPKNIRDLKWYEKYKETVGVNVERRVEDATRISKFILSGKGLLWESRMAGLQTMQNDFEKDRLSKYQNIQKGSTLGPNLQQGSSSEQQDSLWQSLKGALISAGKSVAQGIQLTTSTLAQTVASGTGYHHDTYISRAYLSGEKSSFFGQLKEAFGWNSKSNASGSLWDQVPKEKTLIGDRETISKQTGGSYKFTPVSESYYGIGTSVTSSLRGFISKPTPENFRGVSFVNEHVRDKDFEVVKSKYNFNPETFVENILDEEAKNKISGKKTADVSLSRDKIAPIFYQRNLKPHGFLGYQPEDRDLEYNYRYEKEDPNLTEELGLIPFCITTITPDHRTYINFPAYLESYNDNYNGEWESTQYIGRAEKFYGYSGFSRNLSISFKIAILRKEDTEEMYHRLNRLAGATAPSYGEKGLFMRGTLTSLTIGDLLKHKTGFINSISIKWNTNYLWDLGSMNSEDSRIEGSSYRVPFVLDVDLQFTPIEEQTVTEDNGRYFVFEPEARPLTVVREENKEVQLGTEESSSRSYNVGPQEVGPQIDNTWDKDNLLVPDNIGPGGGASGRKLPAIVEKIRGYANTHTGGGYGGGAR